MDHKASVRSEVFATLRTVAYPDSRFHFDFGEFIADFQGSERAVERLLQDPFYGSAKSIFITPDNCLEQLRYRSLLDGKVVLTTSYSIKRGFWLLRKQDIAPEKWLYASTLDGMERVGRSLSLQDIVSELPRVDYLVTGTGAINEQGIRFGKGHGPPRRCDRHGDASRGGSARLPGPATGVASGSLRYGGRCHLHTDPNDSR